MARNRGCRAALFVLSCVSLAAAPLAASKKFAAKRAPGGHRYVIALTARRMTAIHWRAKAKTLRGLIARTKPLFVCRGHHGETYLIWISPRNVATPTFTMDCAYQVGDGPVLRRWVLLPPAKQLPGVLYRQIRGGHRRAELLLGAPAKLITDGGGTGSSAATVLSRISGHGMVCWIKWESMMGGGGPRGHRRESVFLAHATEALAVPG